MSWNRPLPVIVFAAIFCQQPAVLAQTDQTETLPAEKLTISQEDIASIETSIRQEYIDFLDRVYETMEKNYYLPIYREKFEKFIDRFNEKIYPQLKGSGKTSNYVRWRSAAYMVDYLKDPEDTYSTFFPPRFAEEFEHKVLGEKVDLGLIGEMTDKGFKVTRVEPRSDAYAQGIRENDTVIKIGEIKVATLTLEKVNELLTPLIDTKVTIEYIESATEQEKTVELLSQEYFKQSVFMTPVDVPGVFCLTIRTFNRKTSEDLFRFLTLINNQETAGLILDLRGNPGGPPLAAREISSFFLKAGEDFAYFQKQGDDRAELDVPEIPEQFHYDGPMVILVNKDCGSAAELFAGIMQNRKRAVLIGQNTAGQVFLKSMFHFDDESMVLLVTARGFFPDGTPFSFNGVVPDQLRQENDNELLHYAAEYLAVQRGLPQ